MLFEVLRELKEGGYKFRISVLGEQYEKNPGIAIIYPSVYESCEMNDKFMYQLAMEGFSGKIYAIHSSLKRVFFIKKTVFGQTIHRMFNVAWYHGIIHIDNQF